MLPWVSWSKSQFFKEIEVVDFTKTALSKDVDHDELVIDRKQAIYFSLDVMDVTNNSRLRERILRSTAAGLRYAIKEIKTRSNAGSNEK
jgi:hypothetical protein